MIEIIAIVLATAIALIVLLPAVLALVALCLGREIHAGGKHTSEVDARSG